MRRLHRAHALARVELGSARLARRFRRLAETNFDFGFLRRCPSSRSTQIQREESEFQKSAKSVGIGLPSQSGARLAYDSDPTTHFAFVLRIRLTKFRGEISLFAKDNDVMK